MKSDVNVITVNTHKKPNWVNTVISSISSRFSSSLFGVSKNGKRDINDIYGYHKTLGFAQLYAMWRRGGLAARIVNGFPRSCWRDGILITKNGKPVLEEEIKTLVRKGKLLKRLEQADVLNRIGRYSILFVGVPDGLTPDKPIGTVRGDRLREVYFRAYAEDSVNVVKWIDDVTNPLHGMPEIYQLQTTTREQSDLSIVAQSINVHYSRVIQMSEGSLENDIDGVSCLEPIFNTLEDLVKTTGGSAEAYFRNARNRFSMETDPSFNSSLSAAEKAALENEAQAFQNEWQDFIRAGGIRINPLNIPHNDPTGTVKVQLQILSGATGYPIRILTGEGAGQLAGNEDKESYNQMVQDRRDMFCTEAVDGVFQILSSAGMMSYEDSYEVSWPTPEVVSEKDKSVIAQANGAALGSIASAISSPALDGVLPPIEAIRLVFGEEATIDLNLEEPDDGLSEDELLKAGINPLTGQPLSPETGEPTEKETTEDEEESGQETLEE